MAVLPEGLKNTDGRPISESVSEVERYIQYMRERIEMAFANVLKNGGSSSSEEIEQIERDLREWILLQGFQTADRVEEAITSKGYQTAEQVDEAIEEKGYITMEDVPVSEANLKDVSVTGSKYDIDLSDSTQFSADGATYGWTYNSTYGLCPGNSKTIRGSQAINSYAYCKFSFTLEISGDITITYAQDSEKNYDFAIFSGIDVALAKSTTVDSGAKASTKGLTEGTVVYENVPAGTHFITFKYKTDSSTSTGLDMCYITKIEVDEKGQRTFKNLTSGEEYHPATIEEMLANKDIFWAKSGSTTFSQVHNAIAEGKIPVCLTNGRLYVFVYESSTAVYFASIEATSTTTNPKIHFYSLSSTWSSGSFTLEMTSRRTNDIESLKANTDYYPSCKGVADYVTAAIGSAMEAGY